MSSLSDLALKGHFEQLKDKFQKKGMSKAGSKESLISSLKIAVSTIEDLYEKSPGSFTNEHRKNYISLVSTLNDSGSEYNGHPDLMNRKQESPTFEKRPMAKARRNKRDADKNRKAG